jgi:HEAT repeat protein
MQSDRAPDRVLVPFRLDDGLGPNIADVMLVMCRFSIPLTGSFSISISGNRLHIHELDINGAPFELYFADDFPVRVTDLHMEKDAAGESPPGSLYDPDESGRFVVENELFVQVRMLVHFQDTAEWVIFRTPLTISAVIDRNAIHVDGQFAFHLEGYERHRMPAKLGTCHVLLNASSILQCQILPRSNRLELSFAERTAILKVTGNFSLGLDGLEIRVLDLNLRATPLQFPGLLKSEAITVSLDARKSPVIVDFAVQDLNRYRIRTTIPAVMSTTLAIEGFPPQPLSSPLLLELEGIAELGKHLDLRLKDRVGVAIGDGMVWIEVRAHLKARITSQVQIRDELESQRRLSYAALRAAGETDAMNFSAFAKALMSPDRTTRFLAVDILRARESLEARDMLVAALGDQAPEVRAAAANALGKLGGTSQAVPLLETFHEDPDETVRLAALEALADLESGLWLEATQSALHDDNEVLRCRAAIILSRRGRQEAIGSLLNTLADPNPFVQLCAAIGLMDVGYQEAVDVIAGLSRDDDVCVQMISAIALGQTQSDTANQVLKETLENHQDVFVRQAALYALARQQSKRGPGKLPGCN